MIIRKYSKYPMITFILDDYTHCNVFVIGVVPLFGEWTHIMLLEPITFENEDRTIVQDRLAFTGARYDDFFNFEPARVVMHGEDFVHPRCAIAHVSFVEGDDITVRPSLRTTYEEITPSITEQVFLSQTDLERFRELRSRLLRSHLSEDMRQNNVSSERKSNQDDARRHAEDPDSEI